MRIGITGHTNLTDGAAALVYRALVQHLRAFDGAAVIGVTCLATGADQLFARAVQAVGGTYDVILPAPDYRSVVPRDRRPEFDALLADARAVVYTGEQRSGVKAYVAANRLLLTRVEQLIAVWDGASSNDPGGTADVVSRARHAGVRLTVIWPAGAERT